MQSSFIFSNHLFSPVPWHIRLCVYFDADDRWRSRFLLGCILRLHLSMVGLLQGHLVHFHRWMRMILDPHSDHNNMLVCTTLTKPHNYTCKDGTVFCFVLLSKFWFQASRMALESATDRSAMDLLKGLISPPIWRRVSGLLFLFENAPLQFLRLDGGSKSWKQKLDQ